MEDISLTLKLELGARWVWKAVRCTLTMGFGDGGSREVRVWAWLVMCVRG